MNSRHIAEVMGIDVATLDRWLCTLSLPSAWPNAAPPPPTQRSRSASSTWPSATTQFHRRDDVPRPQGRDVLDEVPRRLEGSDRAKPSRHRAPNPGRQNETDLSASEIQSTATALVRKMQDAVDVPPAGILHHLHRRQMPTSRDIPTLSISNDVADRLLTLSSDSRALESLGVDDRRQLGGILKTITGSLQVPLRDQLFPDTGPLRRELYPRHIEHFAAGKDYKERLFMAGNRIGKTYAGGYEYSDVSARGGIRRGGTGWVTNEPGNFLVGSKTTRLIKRITQYTLFGRTLRDERGKFMVSGTGMIPFQLDRHGGPSIFNPAAAGTLSEIQVHYKDSAFDRTRCSSSPATTRAGRCFEGTAQDGIWFDEEADIELYSQALVRTMTTDPVASSRPSRPSTA